MFKKSVAFGLLAGTLYTLISLGLWQVDRLAWKNEIVANIQAQNDIDPNAQALSLDKITDYQRGYVIGRFTSNKPLFLSPRTRDGQSGYHVIQPFQTASGKTILVNRGWVETRSAKQVPLGRIKIAGYLQEPDKAKNFTPPNRPGEDLWYSLKKTDVEAYFFVKLPDHALYLEYLNGEKPETPVAFDGLPAPKNKHLQYAIFWFSSASTLSVLVIIAVRRKA